MSVLLYSLELTKSWCVDRALKHKVPVKPTYWLSIFAENELSWNMFIERKWAWPKKTEEGTEEVGGEVHTKFISLNTAKETFYKFTLDLSAKQYIPLGIKIPPNFPVRFNEVKGLTLTLQNCEEIKKLIGLYFNPPDLPIEYCITINDALIPKAPEIVAPLEEAVTIKTLIEQRKKQAWW